MTAIEVAMSGVGIKPADLAGIFVADEQMYNFDRIPKVSAKLHRAPFTFNFDEFGSAELSWLGELGLGAVPKHVVCHSIAHAAAGIYMHGADDCAVLVYDGYGTCCGTMAYQYKDGTLSLLEQWRDRFLLGLRYSAFGNYVKDIKKSKVTDFLDFAGKIMGLHSYGEPDVKIVEGFKNAFRANNYYEYHSSMFAFLPRYEDFISLALNRAPGLQRDSLSVADKSHLSIIASMQEAFTQVVCEGVEELLDQTGTDSLLVSGGCGLNIVTNQRLDENPRIRDFFVPPNCDDRGIAMGAAVIGDSALSERPLHHPDIPLAWRRNPYIGCPFVHDLPDGQWGVDVVDLPRQDKSSVKQVAQRLAGSGIIGLVQGLSEIGPRALGHRSILASATDPNMRDLINQKIKVREWWRPFAPVCRSVDVHEYFEVTRTNAYMLIGNQVRDSYRSSLGAITHVDGSARVQTLDSRDRNPVLWDLLEAMKELTGVGVLLNTSFNLGGRPLVNRMSAVVEMLNQTQMDGVWLNDQWLSKAREAGAQPHPQ